MNESMQITSVKNPRIKQVVQLRDRRGRNQQNRIVIDGTREVTRALAANVDIAETYYCESLVRNADAKAALAELRCRNAHIFAVSEMVWDKINYGNRTDGLLVVAVPPNLSLAGIEPAANSLFVVLDSVEKPGNIGAACRTADAVGANGLFLSDSRTDAYNPNAIRASLGTIFTLPFVSDSGMSIRDWLLQSEIRVCTAIVDAQTRYDEVDFTGPTAFVLGSESHGLGDVWRTDRGSDRHARITPIRLPMCGVGDSLNVSTTAAILLYEALRQRTRKAKVAAE